jgi:hypothetical protein
VYGLIDLFILEVLRNMALPLLFSHTEMESTVAIASAPLVVFTVMGLERTGKRVHSAFKFTSKRHTIKQHLTKISGAEASTALIRPLEGNGRWEGAHEASPAVGKDTWLGAQQAPPIRCQLRSHTKRLDGVMPE